MSNKAPCPKGKISPVVYDTVREIGGGDRDTVWKNIVSHGAKPSRRQVDQALDNGTVRGYYIFHRRADKRRVFYIASEEHYTAIKRKRLSKAHRKAKTTKAKVTKSKNDKLKQQQQQAAHARAVLAKKRAAAKKAPKLKTPVVEKPVLPTFDTKWLVIAGLSGAAWGFLTGFALAVWVVV